MTCTEDDALDEFIDERLAKGYICCKGSSALGPENAYFTCCHSLWS